MIPLKKVTEETVGYNSIADYIEECVRNNTHPMPIMSIDYSDYTILEYNDMNLGFSHLSKAIDNKLHIKNVTINDYRINENGTLLVTTTMYEPIN